MAQLAGQLGDVLGKQALYAILVNEVSALATKRNPAPHGNAVATASINHNSNIVVEYLCDLQHTHTILRTSRPEKSDTESGQRPTFGVACHTVTILIKFLT